PSAALELPELTLTPLAVESTTAKFDLNLALVETEAGLLGTLEYSSELFAAPTIARLLRHLQLVLEHVVAAPQTRLAELPLLSSAERQQLLLEWNATSSRYPQDGCL